MKETMEQYEKNPDIWRKSMRRDIANKGFEGGYQLSDITAKCDFTREKAIKYLAGKGTLTLSIKINDGFINGKVNRLVSLSYPQCAAIWIPTGHEFIKIFFTAISPVAFLSLNLLSDDIVRKWGGIESFNKFFNACFFDVLLKKFFSDFWVGTPVIDTIVKKVRDFDYYRPLTAIDQIVFTLQEMADLLKKTSDETKQYLDEKEESALYRISIEKHPSQYLFSFFHKYQLIIKCTDI